MSGFQDIMDDISYGLQELSHGMRSSLGGTDLGLIGGILLIILLVIIVYDIIAYIYLTNLSRSYSPALFGLVSKAWEYRNELGINPAKYISARTLETINPVLFAIQTAIEKYE